MLHSSVDALSDDRKLVQSLAVAFGCGRRAAIWSATASTNGYCRSTFVGSTPETRRVCIACVVEEVAAEHIARRVAAGAIQEVDGADLLAEPMRAQVKFEILESADLLAHFEDPPTRQGESGSDLSMTRSNPQSSGISSAFLHCRNVSRLFRSIHVRMGSELRE